MKKYTVSSSIPYQLELTQQLLNITNKILSENINNSDWIKRLLDWGNQHIKNNSTIFPRTEKEVLSGKKISLRWNRLVYIPTELCYLKQLKILELNNNNLTKLPREIGTLKNLEELNLNINNLINLPDEIIQLEHLKVLNIKNNKYLELTNKQISWLESLVFKGCTIIYDKHKFNIEE